MMLRIVLKALCQRTDKIGPREPPEDVKIIANQVCARGRGVNHIMADKRGRMSPKYAGEWNNSTNK